ncbi:MAG: NUDIX hydrolase [Thermoanaerobaculia bacterium]|nr:NUDIX hydrolase [Thermoanaerobaculia bacterium]
MANVTPVPAASVLLLRDAPLSVLMMRRHEKSSFVPNMWVFPGGAVEESDRAIANGSELDTMRLAAARETFEETGIWLGDETRTFAASMTLDDLQREAPLDLERLTWTSHWITPAGIPIRFDTWFFVTKLLDGAIAPVESAESDAMLWIEPREALARHERGEFPLVFPTVKNLEAILDHNSADGLIESRRGATIVAVQPRILVENGRKKIVLP